MAFTVFGRTAVIAFLLAGAAGIQPASAQSAADPTPPAPPVPPAAPGAAAGAEAAAPADEPGEIVVTAQRRAERSRDVPISITTIDNRQLATANVTQLSDTARLTPGLRFDSQGAAVQPTIRGVGTAITTSGGGPNVGIYVDGFFQSNPYLANFELLKVQSIQVLKGPQGTLFGRNTTGGAILVTTADPSTTTAFEGQLRYSRFDAVRAQAYGTFGLSDRLAVDVEALYSGGDGFQTDLRNGDKNVGRYRNWSARAGLKAVLTDDVSLIVRYTHAETDDPTAQLVNAYTDNERGQSGFLSKVSAAGRAVYGTNSTAGRPLVYFYAPAGTFATRPGDVRLNDPISFKTTANVIQGTLRADLGSADLTSYTQYRHDKSPYNGDLDVTTLPFFQINVPVNNRTFSQEFLLNSKPGTRLQYTAGLNYYQNRDTWDVNGGFGGALIGNFGGSSTFTKSYAVFADLTYALTDRLFLTAGARYSHDVVTDAYFRTNFAIVSYEGANGQPVSTIGIPPETQINVPTLKNNSVTPRVVLRYKPDDQSSVYASFTRGYKAGILNVGGLSAVPVKPEKINAFEAGYKFDNRTLAVDLSGYYYDYKNLQVSSYQNGAAQIRNAASSEIYGAEAQVRYRVSDDFSLNGGIAWTHARYKSFRNAPFYSYCDPTAPAFGDLGCGLTGPGALTQTTTDASGFKMQRAPDFTGNIGASYGLDVARGRLMLSSSLYYTSSFFFDPSQQFRQKGYEVLALRAQWTDPTRRFDVAVFGDNVTGRRYRTQVLFNTLGIGGTWSQPVTYGVQLGVHF